MPFCQAAPAVPPFFWQTDHVFLYFCYCFQAVSGKLNTCYYFCYCFQAVGQRNLVAAEARVKGELEKRQREIQELQNQAKFHMAHAQGLQETLNKQQQQQQQVR